MATTTYEAIRSAFVLALEGRAPTKRTDVRFRAYPGDMPDIAVWAQQVGEGAFRVFDLQHGFDTQILGPFDLLVYTVEHSVQLVVAYPIVSLRYGAESDARGDAVIEADTFDLNKAIGQPAIQSSVWPAGLANCQLVAQAIEDREHLRLLRLTFLLNYQRSNPS